jgi:hypothetical protein
MAEGAQACGCELSGFGRGFKAFDQPAHGGIQPQLLLLKPRILLNEIRIICG